MPLPAPTNRHPSHTRSVVYRGYDRDDGLWDIEGELFDSKAHPVVIYERGELAPGTPIHHMAVRVTVDDHLVVQAIVVSLETVPFGECRQAGEPAQQLVGATLGPGWRQALDRAMGATRGCTHLREMLMNLATAAYQTVPHGNLHRSRRTGMPKPKPPSDQPPYHLGRCLSWDVDGPVVARTYPQFAGWAPLRRVERPKA